MKFPSFKKKAAAEKVKKEKPKKEKKEKAPKAAGGKSSRLRVLVLVLLLVVLGGVGVCFYLGIPLPGMPEPAKQAPLTKQVKRQPIAKPKSTAIAKKPIPKPPQTAKKKAVPAKPVKGEAKQVVEEKVSKEVVASVAKKTVVEKKPVVTKKEKPSTKKPVVAVKKAVPAPVKPSLDMTRKPVVKPASGDYTVQVGTYLMPKSVTTVQNKLRKLGFEPIVTNVRQSVKMTRLRAGAYPDKAAAVARVKQLKSVAPDSFYLKAGEEYRVYVGSFSNIDYARRFADKLYTRGVLLEEEEVSIKQTLRQVSFGAFTDKKSAGQAAARARKAGLDTTISKQP